MNAEDFFLKSYAKSISCHRLFISNNNTNNSDALLYLAMRNAMLTSWFSHRVANSLGLTPSLRVSVWYLQAASLVLKSRSKRTHGNKKITFPLSVIKWYKTLPDSLPTDLSLPANSPSTCIIITTISATIVSVTGLVIVRVSGNERSGMISEDPEYSKIQTFRGSAPNPAKELTVFPPDLLDRWWEGGLDAPSPRYPPPLSALRASLSGSQGLAHCRVGNPILAAFLKRRR